MPAYDMPFAECLDPNTQEIQWDTHDRSRSYLDIRFLEKTLDFACK